MIYSLIILGNHLTNGHHAFKVAQDLIAQKHTINQIYFLFDGVYVANKFIDMPVDEYDLAKNWVNFANANHIPLLICAASGFRRGIVKDTISTDFEFGTIGQLVDSCDKADKIITI